VFLERALENSKVTYSVHKTSTLDFIKTLSKRLGGKITHVFRMDMQLKSTMKWHKSSIKLIDVSAVRIEK